MRARLNAVLVLCCAVASLDAAIQLSGYNVDPALVTVGGLSSGAAMATQVHVALSDMVHGAAIFAGVPYYCAFGTLAETVTCMDTPGLINVQTLISETATHAASGSIASPDNMADDPVFIFAGTLDTVVHPKAGEKVEQYYQHYKAQITTEFTKHAEHCQPTFDYGPACSHLGGEYINNCDYNGAFKSLSVLYDDISDAGDITLEGNFTEFDQKVFFEDGDPSKYSMDDVGYIYIPSQCESGASSNTTCKLHVVLHGCLQGRYEVDDHFARNTDYLPVAEKNNIITVFPQAIAEMIGNPNGCWDWWGYTGSRVYATNSGPQIMAIQKMIQAITG